MASGTGHSAVENACNAARAARQHCHPHQHARRGYARHHVGVGRARHDARTGHIDEEMRHLQVHAGGEQQEESRGEEREVQPRLSHDRDASSLREVQRARQHVGRGRANERHDDDGDADLLHQIEQRQAEHIEADVVPQDRIVDAERHGVPELEPAHPLAAAGQGDHQGDDQGADTDDLAYLLAPNHRRLHGTRSARADEDVRARDRRHRDPQVAVEHREREAQDEGEERRLGPQARHIDLAIPDGAEPQPLDEERDEIGQDDERDDGTETQKGADIHVGTSIAGAEAALGALGAWVRRGAGGGVREVRLLARRYSSAASSIAARRSSARQQRAYLLTPAVWFHTLGLCAGAWRFSSRLFPSSLFRRRALAFHVHAVR